MESRAAATCSAKLTTHVDSTTRAVLSVVRMVWRCGRRAAPSAALQTGGTTAQNAKFIQKFGYWEARFKVPHNTHGEGTGLHSDFWMHPIPEGVGSPTEWLPEINVGERPTWDANLEKANNQIYFGIHDYGPWRAER